MEFMTDYFCEDFIEARKEQERNFLYSASQNKKLRGASQEHLKYKKDLK